MKKYILMTTMATTLLATSCQEEVLNAVDVPLAEAADLGTAGVNVTNEQIPLVGTLVGGRPNKLLIISPGDTVAPSSSVVDILGGQVARAQYRIVRFAPGYFGGGGPATTFLAQVDEAPFTFKIPTTLIGTGNEPSLLVDLLDSEGNILRTVTPVLLENGREIRLSGSVTPILEGVGRIPGGFGLPAEDGDYIDATRQLSNTVLTGNGQRTTIQINAVAGTGLYDVALLVNDPQLASRSVQVNINGQEETLTFPSFQLTARDLEYATDPNTILDFKPFTYVTFRARLAAGENVLTITSLSDLPISLRKVLAVGVLATPVSVPFGPVIEAESGVLRGGSLFEEQKFSGSKGVRLAQPGQSVVFTLNAEQTGGYRFLINALVSISNTNVQADVIVNGKKQNEQALEFKWNYGQARQIVPYVDLQAGKNTVEVKFTGIRGRNIDDLEIDFVSFGFNTAVARLPIIQ